MMSSARLRMALNDTEYTILLHILGIISQFNRHKISFFGQLRNLGRVFSNEMCHMIMQRRSSVHIIWKIRCSSCNMLEYWQFWFTRILLTRYATDTAAVVRDHRTRVYGFLLVHISSNYSAPAFLSAYSKTVLLNWQGRSQVFLQGYPNKMCFLRNPMNFFQKSTKTTI